MATHQLPESDDAQPLRTVGPYELLDLIGQGGMGVIYRARDVSLDRIVALKILREDLQSQPDVVARFHREARAAARLNHPNIVQIYAVGHVDGLPYIAMEFVQGVPLSALMQQVGKLPWRRSLHIAEQVARALVCAHEAQVIHRDIKPSNILIDEEGRAYVTDFGIAKILSIREQLTVDGSRLGTPQYMSPERCRDEEVTAASDIYSLGVVLFQMIAGRLPLEAASSVELVRRILSEPPARLRQFVPSAPESVERLVAYLIEKRPGDRPDSAERVCEAIHLVLQGRPLDEIRIPMRSALAEFRRSGVDAPAFTAQDATTRFLPDTRLARFTHQWFGTSQPWKVGVALAAVVVAGVVLGVSIDRVLREDPRLTQARELRRDVSAWKLPPDVGAFQRDPGGGFRVSMGFPSHRVGRLVWGYDTLFVELAGQEDTDSEGKLTVCSVSPAAEGVAVSVPPWSSLSRQTVSAAPALLGAVRVLPAGTDAALVRVDRVREDGDSAVLLCGPRASYDPVRPLMSTSPSPRPAVVAAAAVLVSCAAVSPQGGRMAFGVREEGSSAWRVMELVLNPDGTWLQQVVTPTGPMVDELAYAPAGSAIALSRRLSPSSAELWLQPVGGPGAEATRLASANLHITPGAFDSAFDSRRITYEERIGIGEPRVRLLPIEDPAAPVDLGPGVSPYWHPSGAYILALARDRSGQRQLFAIEPTTPYQRRQITFLSGSLAAPCCVSGDGKWAAATVDDVDEPTIILTGLTNVRFR